ncbi:NUDIX hydrolase [Photobacterium alginatilyticum]
MIVPLTNNGELVMVRQYRPAIQKWILEFPAGTLESQEDILSCAKRELAEEVQLKAEHWQDLGELLPVPGFCDEVQYLFFAKELSACSGELDDDEIIEVITLTVDDFEMNVTSGEIQDAKTLSAFFKARLLKLL